MTVSDNKKLAESHGDFFKNVGKKGLNVSKKMAKTYQRTQDETGTSQQKLLLQLLPKILKI